jgi:hypothetical protein
MINRILLIIAEILLKECSDYEKYVYFCAGKIETWQTINHQRKGSGRSKQKMKATSITQKLCVML